MLHNHNRKRELLRQIRKMKSLFLLNCLRRLKQNPQQLLPKRANLCQEREKTLEKKSVLTLWIWFHWKLGPVVLSSRLLSKASLVQSFIVVSKVLWWTRLHKYCLSYMFKLSKNMQMYVRHVVSVIAFNKASLVQSFIVVIKVHWWTRLHKCCLSYMFKLSKNMRIVCVM